MRKSIITLWLLSLTLCGLSQSVTIPAQKLPVSGLEAYQTKAEAKKQADSLAAALRSEFAGSTPGQPSQPDCEHGIDLVSVYNVTGLGLEYNFYSVGVSRLTEVIYGSTGREVLRHTTDPVTKDRIQIPYNLRPGNYTLVVQNADCKAVSQPKAFTIPEDAPTKPDPGWPGDPSVPSTGFYNPGVYKKEVGSILYEWIPTENVEVVVNNGLVKIKIPESKKSWDGSNNCRPFIIGDNFDNKLSEADEKALLGNGLALPPGQHEFKVLYFNAKKWSEVSGNKCKFFSYGHSCSGADANSARAELLIVSVFDGNSINGIDGNQYRASWIPQYQLLPGSLKLPENKAFGVTRYITSVPKDTLMSKISHIQYIYGWVDNVDKSRAWKNQQAIGDDGSWKTLSRIFDENGNRVNDGIAEPQWHIDRAVINKGYILMSEYTENYGNKRGCPQCYEKGEEVYKGIYARYQRELGVTSPEQTWIGSDYFAPLWDGSLSLSFNERSTILSDGLSSISLAKMRRYDGAWDWVGYFTRGRIDYRNYFSQGYLPHLWGMVDSPALYERLYNHEKANLAISNRKKITYGTLAQEGLREDRITISGVWYKTLFKEGELLRADGIVHSFNTMMSDAFFALLLGDAFVLWESSITMNVDPYTFQQSWFGGFDENKTKWKPNGGATNTYKPGTNGPPQIQADGQFPEKPLIGDQGAWVGAKLYSSITGRINELWWPDYWVNTTPVVANKGSKGNSLSYNKIQNEGQDQIVKLYERSLPIVMKGRGPEGEVIIYQNPNAGLTEEQGVEVEGRFFKVVGNRLNVIKL